MPIKTFPELLSGQATYNSDTIAVVYGDKHLSWKELNEGANRLSNALLDLGVKKGDKVSQMLPDSLEFVESTYAIQKIGAIPVPMNYRFVSGEIEYQTNNSDSTVFITEEAYLGELNKARPNLKNIKEYICLGETKGDMLNYEELIGKYPSSEPGIDVMEDDIATISYTGGTTGLPKGVVLPYSNFWSLGTSLVAGLVLNAVKNPDAKLAPVIGKLLSSKGAESIGGLLDMKFTRSILASSLTEEILKMSMRELILGNPKMAHLLHRILPNILPLRFLLCMPLFHMANWQILVLAPFTGLFSLILPTYGSRFSPANVLETVEREKVQMAALVPTQWRKVVEFPEIDRYDRSSLILPMTGAGINPAELKKKIFEKFPNSALMSDVFGQTEMTPDATIRIDTDPEKLKDRSVGKPIVETRLLNEEGEEIEKPGEIGELVYRGPTVMREYYRDESKTREAFTKDGWFYSGDLAYFDEDGDYFIVDRLKECISTGAEKVYPHEIEEILESNPKVRYVCIIGIPDEMWGQAVRAVIELNKGEEATEEEIIDWCRDKMTGFKRPKSVVFADSLPLNPVEKVMRSQVKEKYGKT